MSRQDTITYRGVTYSVTRQDGRWFVSDGTRTEDRRSLIEAFDVLLGTSPRDDDLLGIVVRFLAPH